MILYYIIYYRQIFGLFLAKRWWCQRLYIQLNNILGHIPGGSGKTPLKRKPDRQLKPVLPHVSSVFPNAKRERLRLALCVQPVCVRMHNNRAQTLIEIQSVPRVWDLCAFPETNMRRWSANTDDQWATLSLCLWACGEGLLLTPRAPRWLPPPPVGLWTDIKD